MRIRINESFRSKGYGILRAGTEHTVDDADGAAWIASGKASKAKPAKREKPSEEEMSHE